MCERVKVNKVPNTENEGNVEGESSMQARIPLTKSQKEILREFYSVAPTQVIFERRERKKIWDDFIRDSKRIPDLDLKKRCPALLAELQKSIDNEKLIQSAVFSECVYAQTLANMLRLELFHNFSHDPSCLSDAIVRLLDSYHLKARYVYLSRDGRRALIQAGGYGGIDSALITVHDSNVFTIEFKEPSAKTSEPDLPAYSEDGFLKVSEEFISKNPQFEMMLREQIGKRLNFWKVLGSNVHDFSVQSIQVAVSENYAAKKYADVICVEDVHGFLTMLPANQVGMWADIRGEIRPAGRNLYKVWTPKALQGFIEASEGLIEDGLVTIPAGRLTTAKARGGSDQVHRYKINPVFFVYASDVVVKHGEAHFRMSAVSQIKPTISAHMFFKNLSIAEAHKYYSTEF